MPGMRVQKLKMKYGDFEFVGSLWLQNFIQVRSVYVQKVIGQRGDRTQDLRVISTTL